MFYFNHQTKFSCVICSDEISKLRFRQHKICEKLDCSIKHRRQCKIERKTREAKESQKLVSKMLGVPFDDLKIAVVPAMTRALRPQEESRRKEFVEHLKKVIREGVNAEYCKDFESSEIEFAPTKAECNACHACGGACCTGGGTHAYLKPDVFREILDRHPDRTASQMFRDYLRRLPTESHEDSCIYHGEKGCTLDRDMRSNTCNTYRCTELIQLLDRKEANLTIVAKEEYEHVRVCHEDKVQGFET